MENYLQHQMQTRTKGYIWIVIAGLTISGLTAFPLESELKWLINNDSIFPEMAKTWLLTIHDAIADTNTRYPYLGYGTDWLAFAHLMLAILFLGPLKNPVKNIWVIEFGMIACVLIFPLAFIAGSIRNIPLFWRLIDCSFGFIGIIPLALAYKNIKNIEAAQIEVKQHEVFI